MQKLDGLCFSVGQDPAVVKRALKMVAADTRAIRTYSPEPYHEEALALGLDVVPCAWIGEDRTAHIASLDRLIATCNRHETMLAVVGNETMMRSYFPPELLIEHLRYVRAHVPKRTLVTTAEDAEYLLKFPQIMQACDVVGMHHYPFWHQVPIEHALSDFDSTFRRVRVASGYKDVFVLETGWPSGGGVHSWIKDGVVFRSSVACIESAHRYFHDIIAWSKRTGVQVFWFEAFNELWKAHPNIEGAPGGHWGLRACPESDRKYWLDTAAFQAV